MIGIQEKIFTDLHQIINELIPAEHIDPTLKAYELEGWVLRQKFQIAKIRKSDLRKFEV